MGQVTPQHRKLSLLLSVYLWGRCYSAGGETGSKTQAEIVAEDRKAALKELEPLKLPGHLAGYTGNVMYPNEESSVWDIDSKLQQTCVCVRVCGCVCLYIYSVCVCV